LIKAIEERHENHREKAGCGIMRRKNGNKEPLPAIQTTIEFHITLFSSRSPFLLQKASSPTLKFFRFFDVFIGLFPAKILGECEFTCELFVYLMI
jgi:hypothetical protein